MRPSTLWSLPAAIALRCGLTAFSRPLSTGAMVATSMPSAPVATAPLRRPQQARRHFALRRARRRQKPQLPLAPRGQASTARRPAATDDALLTTLGSLAVVLCLFFAVAWVLRRGTPHSPSGACRAKWSRSSAARRLPGRHQMHLVRCGNKLLLVAVSTAGADTLTEITDPAEVDRLCGLCRAESSARARRQRSATS